MTYAADILALSPLAFYRLNETSSLVDSSGNARHGTFVGTAPTVVAGLTVGDADQALLWATSGRGEVADAAWMDAGSFTIVATIKPTNVALVSPEILCRYNGTASGTWSVNSFAFRMAGNKLQGVIFNGASTTGSATGSTVMVNGTTYDVAMRYNGTTGAIRIYLNGVLEATATRTGMNNSSMPLTIGSTLAPTEPWAGTIDDLAYFGSELTDDQIATLSWSRRGSPAVSARAHTVMAEVLGEGTPAARAHTVMAEVLGELPQIPARAHSTMAEVLAPLEIPPGPPTHVSVASSAWGPILSWDPPTSGGPLREYETRRNGTGKFTADTIGATIEESYRFDMPTWFLVSGLSYTWGVRSSGPGGFSEWVEVSSRAPFIYRETILASTTWVPPDHCQQVDVILVGGGGGGGSAASGGGGGGGGGVAFHYNLDVTPGVGVPVVVGAGGAGSTVDNTHGTAGQDTTFGSAVGLGGGPGKGNNTTPVAGGGSGGGGVGGVTGAESWPGDLGTPGQGYPGGAGAGSTDIPRTCSGGGGGAGGAGQAAWIDLVPSPDDGHGGNGGAGFYITPYAGPGVGETGYVASGGGGGVRYYGVATPGIGPVGGGGNGSKGTPATDTATAGQANTGGGGGGGGGQGDSTPRDGAAGGSGLVVVGWYRVGISYVDADTFTVPGGVTEVDVLVVGGGAGGGSGVPSIGTAVGGGGAGGYGWFPATAVTPGDSIAVTVGAGGAVGSGGGSSSFGALSRLGGGTGASGFGVAGASGGGGGSGGGSGVQRAGGAGTPGQGNAGGYGIGAATSPGRRGGGGGGAGGVGEDALQANPIRGKGGPGIDSSTRVGWALYAVDGWFSGGGSGGDQEGSVATMPGGQGGGSSNNNHGEGHVGIPGTGGGGGGGADEASSVGGRGVVAVLWDPPSHHPNAIKVLSTDEFVQVYYGGEWLTARHL